MLGVFVLNLLGWIRVYVGFWVLWIWEFFWEWYGIELRFVKIDYWKLKNVLVVDFVGCRSVYWRNSLLVSVD